MNHVSIGVAAFVTLLLACGDDAPRTDSFASLPTSAATAPANDAGVAAPRARGATDLAGTVVDEAGVPVFGRPVSVVDARGRSVSILTDDGGSFHVADVVVPYDVSIAGSPSSTAPVTTAWLGLGTASPRFDVLDRDSAPTPPAPATLDMVVTLPPCTNRCWIAAATASRSGRGQAAASYGVGESRRRITIEHAFLLATPDEEEKATIHLLTGDESFSSYAAAEVVSVVVPGTGVDLGVLPLAPTEATGAVTVAVRGPDIPAAWHWTVATNLSFPDGASMTLQYVDGPALVTHLPRLGGASFAIGAWAQSPPENGSLAQNASFAWSGRLSLTASAVAMDLPTPARLLQPPRGGTLSRRADGFSWTARTGASSLVIRDLDRGRPFLRLHAAGASASFDRLARLGIHAPDIGEYLIELTAKPTSSVDDLVSDSAPLSGLEIDSPLAGASAYEQFSFVVTP